MAKKVISFQDKLKKKDGEKQEIVRVVKAYKADNGAWKFKSEIVAVTDENRKEIYG